MIEKTSNSPEMTKCPKCGEFLESGYLLGQYSRIRWSTSKKGMTIFHGVPLLQKAKSTWQKLFCAPNVPAQRCTKCQVVIAPYNNTAPENSTREYLASLILGSALVILGFILYIPIYLLSIFTPEVPHYLYLLIALLITMLFVLLFLGGKVILYAIREARPNQTLKRTE